MNIETISENQHEELMNLLNPLIDFMTANNYHYFLVAGKENVCTRHLRGNFDDLTGMIGGMMEKNKQVHAIIRESLDDVTARTKTPEENALQQ